MSKSQYHLKSNSLNQTQTQKKTEFKTMSRTGSKLDIKESSIEIDAAQYIDDNSFPLLNSDQEQKQIIQNRRHMKNQSEDMQPKSYYLKELLRKKSLTIKSISVMMKSLCADKKEEKKNEQNLPIIENKKKKKAIMNNPIQDHKNELKKQILSRRQTRYFNQNSHFVSDIYDGEDKDVDQQIQDLRHQILRRKVDQVDALKNTRMAQMFYDMNEKKEKIKKESDHVVQQLKEKIQNNDRNKDKKKTIYQDFFRKTIYSKGDKNSSIEGKLAIFKNLNTFIDCQGQLQKINKIYNMGIEKEPKMTTSVGLQKIQELRKNTKKFFKFYIKKDGEEDWINEKYLQKQNNKIARILRNGNDKSILKDLDFERRRGQTQRSIQPQQSMMQLKNKNQKQQMYKLFDYRINSRKDAQRMYDQLLMEEKQDLQGISIKLSQFDNSKCKYEKESLSQKILESWNSIQNQDSYKIVPGYNTIKNKIEKIKNRQQQIETHRQTVILKSMQLKEAQEKERLMKSNQSSPFKKTGQSFNYSGDKFFMLVNQAMNSFKEEKSQGQQEEKQQEEKQQEDRQQNLSFELQSQIHANVLKILNLDDINNVISDLDYQSTSDIIIKNQEKILKQVRGKKMLKDEQIVQQIKNLMKNTQQIFQIGFNKYLLHESKKQKQNELKKFNWDGIFRKISQQIINNTVRSCKKIFNEIQQEKSQDVRLNDQIFKNLVNGKQFDKTDIKLIKNFFVEELKQQNIDFIRKEKEDQERLQEEQYQQ